MDLVNGKLNVGLEDAEGMISQGSNDVVNPVSPLYFDKPLLAGSGYQLRINVDSSMSASSINPVQNKVVKSYVDNAIANLPEEQFLDLTKTEFVENFTWSSTTYPGSTNPNLNGKPVLVLALKDEDGNVAYSFINLEDLITTYSGESPIIVSGSSISHANSIVSTGTYGGSSGLTPAFGETFSVPRFTVDSKGHLSQASDGSVKIPDTLATTSSAGLMSSADKQKLNSIESGAISIKLVSDTLQSGSTFKEIRWGGLTKIVSVMAHHGDYPVIVDWIQINSAGIDVSIAQQYNQDITIDIFYM